MRRLLMVLCLGSVCLVARGGEKPKIMDDGIDMNNKPIYNVGFVDLSSSSNDFTHAEVAHQAISVGQLVGINPENGQLITNAVNLLPVIMRSALVAGEVNAGWFAGNGGGLTNLNGVSIVGYIPIGAMPTSGVWNVSGLTFKNARFEGPLGVGGQVLEVDSDLNVQGKLSGDASGLSHVPAGGENGSIQFNSDGQLAGNPAYFIHPETGRLSSQCNDGNIFRVHLGRTTTDENLVYALRRHRNTVEMCLRSQSVETIRLRGDGSAYFAGSLEVGGDIVFSNGMTAGNNHWYIPESGDLSMGGYIEGAGLAVATGEYVPDASDLSMGNFTKQ